MSASHPEQASTATGAPEPEPRATGQVDRKLLEILVCPLTKGPLRYDAERGELISDRAGLAYPIRDGIPIMLIDEARSLDSDADAGRTGA
ncbi:Trm112 family protein [Azospirillum sp. ST 5-10]|uniref:Trm112 family protein n=1 Tax=unclassified Azospirillum TaxID=2630922 RepID=UPI003F4A84F0